MDNLFRSKTPREAFTVHLVVQNARDHYLGEWSPVEYAEAKDSGPRNCAFVLLKRLRTQSQATAERYTLKTRKQSHEGLHETMLMHFFPDFRIMHEPDCRQHGRARCAERGVECLAGNTTRSTLSSSTRGAIVFPSSPSSREVIDTAALQSAAPCAIAAANASSSWPATPKTTVYLDMGPPQSNEDAEGVHEHRRLKIALQV